jgi:hypothetical protein
VQSDVLVAIASAAVATIAAATAAATVTTTATAAATESAAATAAATESTTASAATATIFARTRFVDGQGPAAMLLAIERRDRRLGFLIGAHLDEAESLGSARVAIVDDLSRNNRAVLCEQLLEFRAIDLVAQVPNIKLLTHYASPVNG